eukprot:9480098-Pyramimonas_sp.AAC.1
MSKTCPNSMAVGTDVSIITPHFPPDKGLLFLGERTPPSVNYFFVRENPRSHCIRREGNLPCGRFFGEN